jgi:hypothetical protein
MTNAFVEMAVHPDHVELRGVKEASNSNSMRTACVPPESQSGTISIYNA